MEAKEMMGIDNTVDRICKNIASIIMHGITKSARPFKITSWTDCNLTQNKDICVVYHVEEAVGIGLIINCEFKKGKKDLAEPLVHIVNTNFGYSKKAYNLPTDLKNRLREIAEEND